MRDIDPFDVFEERDAETEHQRRTAADLEQREEDLKAAWEWLLADKRGRLLAFQILARCGLFSMSYTGNAMSTAFNEGRRDIGHFIMNAIQKIDWRVYNQIIGEYHDERAHRDAVDRARGGDAGRRHKRRD